MKETAEMMKEKNDKDLENEFEYDGKTCVAQPYKDCDDCVFAEADCEEEIPPCQRGARKDEREVHFVEKTCYTCEHGNDGKCLDTEGCTTTEFVNWETIINKGNKLEG